jgi:AraC-like DNA-binding protein
LIGPVEIQPGVVGARDQLRIDTAGAVRVAELTTGAPGGAALTRTRVRRATADLCKVDVVVGGRGVVEQDGRQAMLGPGEFTFVDLSRPVRWRMSAARLVAVVFPRAVLPVRRNGLAELTGVRYSGDRGAADLVSSMARQVARRIGELPGAAGPRLGTALLDLLTVAFAARLGRPQAVPDDTSRRAMLVRVQAFIEHHLGDPDLSPGAVAAAHHISVRYLYLLFEQQGETVAGWIRQRRLDRCQRDLLDPALSGRPVSAIAARWGLTSAGHFSRAFRAAYGLSPTEYRTLAGGVTP